MNLLYLNNLKNISEKNIADEYVCHNSMEGTCIIRTCTNNVRMARVLILK